MSIKLFGLYKKINFKIIIFVFIFIFEISSSVTQNTISIRPRSAWRAKPPRDVNPLHVSPVPFVIIHHTYIPAFCNTSVQCEQAMRSIQRFHMNTRGWLDIGYTFVIAGDGIIYEGRGWDKDGAHSPRYNDRSVGISFIGDFRRELPTREMLEAARRLISVGVTSGKIREDYILLGHRQVRDTECPGQALFNEISKWPHFSVSAPQNPQNYEQFLAAHKTDQNNSIKNN